MSQTPDLDHKTTPAGDMNLATSNARKAFEEQTDRLRPYLPELIQRLLYVYGIPFALILITSTLGGMFLSSFIPVSTTNILILGLNIFVLVQVWRWAEKRWQATGLFVQYSRFSRARRDLKDLLAEVDNGRIQQANKLDDQVSTLRSWADTFIKNAIEAGLTPYEPKR